MKCTPYALALEFSAHSTQGVETGTNQLQPPSYIPVHLHDGMSSNVGFVADWSVRVSTLTVS